MTRDEIRLEALKLVHRNDRSHAENVEAARIYESYILGSKDEIQKPDDQRKPIIRKRPDGNSDILS